GANVYLLGGTITGNAAATGGGIYSEGTVNLKGTVSVTGNTVTDAFSETASATDPTPSPAETKLVVTGKSMKWTGHDSVQLKFQSNVKGTYYIDWVKRGEK
ncbi:hypothetical protein, partial [Erwinia amylovora]|uniref:hypothetical protein n=1 Tax=Erwinia amylovora TaxID=552 RepID=UPI003D6E8B82